MQDSQNSSSGCPRALSPTAAGTPTDPSPHVAMAVGPLDLVDVLEQLPPDVVGTMVLGQLGGDDIRSFKLAAPSTLALVRRTSRVLRLGRLDTQQALLSRHDLESQSETLAKYEACMEVQMDVATTAGISPLLVGGSHGCGRAHEFLQRAARPSHCIALKAFSGHLHAAVLRLDVGVTGCMCPFRWACARPHYRKVVVVFCFAWQLYPERLHVHATLRHLCACVRTSLRLQLLCSSPHLHGPCCTACRCMATTRTAGA